MQKRVLLISEKQIKDQSIIEANVDSKILSKVIQSVQDIQLKGILGKDLYETVLTAVNDFVVSGTTIEASTATLLNDYIQPFLLHAVLVDFISVNHYKLTNKGVLKLRDDVAESVSTNELESAKSFYSNYKAEYKKNLVDYLVANNLVDNRTDHNVTTDSIGWFLENDKPFLSVYDRPYIWRF